MKQDQMAEVLGLKQSSVSRMETEKIELTIAQYQKLYDKFGKEDVDAFKVDIPYFVQSTDDSRVTSPQNETMLDIIKRQTETLCEHVKEQDELNRRIIAILEMMCSKN